MPFLPPLYIFAQRVTWYSCLIAFLALLIFIEKGIILLPWSFEVRKALPTITLIEGKPKVPYRIITKSLTCILFFKKQVCAMLYVASGRTSPLGHAAHFSGRK